MIRVFCDGACSGNPGPMGIGVVIEWQNSAPEIYSEFIGEGTNNVAEYSALNRALKIIYDNEIKVVEINSDSNLIVNQVNGNWRCKDSKLIPLRDKAVKRINYLKEKGYDVKLIYTPRKFNLADTPAKNALKK